MLSRKNLGKHRDQVGPSEATAASFDCIMVVAAAPALRRLASTDKGMVEDGLVQCAEGFPDGAVLLKVDEMAYAVSHLALGFFNKHGSGNAFQGGSRGAGNGVDVGRDKSVVGNGGNHLFHNRVF